MRRSWLMAWAALCCSVVGCGPGGTSKQGSGGGDARQPGGSKAEFNPKSFDESFAWLKAIHARVRGSDNPVVRQETIEAESKKFEEVNGTQVEWKFLVTDLHEGNPPSVQLDGQKMHFADNIAVHFHWGEKSLAAGRKNDTGRVFLEVGKDVSKDVYRGLKKGVPAAVKGTVRIKMDS
jgi:hypothetical protein